MRLIPPTPAPTRSRARTPDSRSPGPHGTPVTLLSSADGPPETGPGPVHGTRRRRHVWRPATPVLLALTIGLGLVGCNDVSGPRLPTGAVRLAPLPPEYAHWWSLTERCSGLEGDLDSVGWFVLPGVWRIPGSRGAVAGYDARGHHILVVEGFERDGSLVRHEMLHALLRRERGHRRDLFVEACGGVVSCGEDCRQDAGSAPSWDLSAPMAAPGSLDLRAEVLPDTLRFPSRTHGCASVVVSIGNPNPGTVAVDVERGRGFDWALEGWGIGGGGPNLADSLVVIPGGRWWEYVMDCPPVFREGLPSGDYLLRGRLQGKESPPVPLTVLPRP